MAIVPEHCQCSAATTPNNQAFPSVSIEIEPGDAGTELAQFARQQRLSLKIIERLVDVCVPNQLADIDKQRLRLRL